MGLWKKATNIVNKVSNAVGFGNTTTGVTKLLEEATGMSPSQQYATGATAGLANMLGGALGTGTEGNATGSNNGLLSSIFGSGDNSLSSVLGAVVKGAVGIGSDYFSNKQYLNDQKELNEQKFGIDRQLADEAYQRDVAMWNMQNAYNAPSAQMARLQSAGLNPNLVYGSGNVTGNTAGSPPSYPQVQYPSSKAQKLDLMRNVLGIFDQYQSIKNQALDNQRQNAKIALQAESLRLADERERRQELADERRFQIMMANLGLQRERMNQPPATVKNLNGLEEYAADKAYSLTSWLAPKVYDWWHRDTSKGSGADIANWL